MMLRNIKNSMNTNALTINVLRNNNMRKLNNIFLIGLLGVFIHACTDVIEVDLEEATPRIVIDAALQWERGTTGNVQEIRISRTRNFFDNEPRFLQGAFVKIEDDLDNRFDFEEVEPGLYRTEAFEPALARRYFLSIQVEDELYEASEVLTPVSNIVTIFQSDDGGFAGGNREVRVFYDDPEEEENFYLFKFFTDFLAFPDFSIQTDEFTNGNVSSVSFSDEDLEVGDVVRIQHHGISRSYYNFLFRLLSQTGAAGGPFQAQPATVRGNIINQTNASNFPFGYFSISEMVEVEVEIIELAD